MTVSTELELQSFVLLRLGERRFAVSANQIAELVAPSRVFRFPHRTPKLEGVILRRRRIVPLCDVSEMLLGKRLTYPRYYLIALCTSPNKTKSATIPLTVYPQLLHP